MAKTDTSEPPAPKPVFWEGSSKKELKKFPKPVRQTFGQALFDAQTGGKHPDAKPLRGFGGAGVLEVVEADRGNTYRAIYTVKFAGLLGLDQPKVSALVRGRVQGYSIDRLFRFLNALGQRVEITVRPKAKGAETAAVVVT